MADIAEFRTVMRAARRKKGMSQAALARAIAGSPSRIGAIETGHCAPTAEEMKRIARVLQLPKAQVPL